MFWLFILLAAISALYFAFNLARLVPNRMNSRFRPHNALRAMVWLAVAVAVSLVLALLARHGALTLAGSLVVLAVLQLAVAQLLAWSTWRQLSATRLDKEVPSLSESKLPTVTIAIPARNEGAQMEACLTSVLASGYPKLEVLVLDDGSEDRTPEIIRSFAQSGVRFIRGDEPADGWLPKNQAYARLASEASGQIILFCGVDVRLMPQTVRQLVALMAHKHKTMLTVLPENPTMLHMPVLQAMRYYWEMAPPRRLFRRPPVLSSCWLIDREVLRKAGGFEAVRRSVTPEAYFARQAIGNDDGYSFVRGDGPLGVTSEKSAAEQRETAIYSRYPQLHRRPELVMLLSVAELLFLLGPLPVAVLSLILQLPAVVTLAAILSFIMQAVTFGAIQLAVFPRIAPWRGWLDFIIAIAADVYFLNLSMYKYEFSEVYWKSRNVCYPVMSNDRRH